MTWLVLRSTTDTFFPLQMSVNYDITHTDLGSTHGIARVMPCDEVDVEVDNIARFHGLDRVQVVLELIPSTQVGVAVVVLVRLFHGIFNGACGVCDGTASDRFDWLFLDVRGGLTFLKLRRKSRSATLLLH